MARTKKGSKGPGYEYWSRRPGSCNHGSGPGPYAKQETHRAERREAKVSIDKELTDEELAKFRPVTPEKHARFNPEPTAKELQELAEAVLRDGALPEKETLARATLRLLHAEYLRGLPDELEANLKEPVMYSEAYTEIIEHERDEARRQLDQQGRVLAEREDEIEELANQRDEARREVEKWKRRAERQGDRIEDGWEECQRLRKVVQMAAQEEQHAYWCPYTMRHDKARQYEPCDCTCHVRAAREALRQALGTDTAEKPRKLQIYAQTLEKISQEDWHSVAEERGIECPTCLAEEALRPENVIRPGDPEYGETEDPEGL